MCVPKKVKRFSPSILYASWLRHAENLLCCLHIMTHMLAHVRPKKVKRCSPSILNASWLRHAEDLLCCLHIMAHILAHVRPKKS